MQELAAARAAGQIILVQWHHTPFSRGIHGTSVTSTQSGEAMRIYAPLMEQYRVAGVFTGHSEVAEMSYFDLDNDGYGVHLWDVGAAGDGLRGVEDAAGATAAAITAWRANPLNTEGAAWTPNPHHRWCADQSEPETWNGNQLLGGGKHYGFLEFDVERLGNGEFRITYQNWHTFPLNSGGADYTVTGYELRPYNNRVVLQGPANNLRPVTIEPTCAQIDLNQDARVDAADIAVLLGGWGTAAGDINGDGTTNGDDLGYLLDGFGSDCRG